MQQRRHADVKSEAFSGPRYGLAGHARSAVGVGWACCERPGWGMQQAEHAHWAGRKRSHLWARCDLRMWSAQQSLNLLAISLIARGSLSHPAWRSATEHEQHVWVRERQLAMVLPADAREQRFGQRQGILTRASVEQCIRREGLGTGLPARIRLAHCARVGPLWAVVHMLGRLRSKRASHNGRAGD